MSCKAEIAGLLNLSARIGQDPLLVQASSGNTSIKLDGTLWIKASGKWLAHATEEEILVPVNLADLRTSLRSNKEVSPKSRGDGSCLRPSIETAMHGILPQSVVIHVHSVNAISWAVRSDGPARLAERLHGMPWVWIPYVPSGLPLAKMLANEINRQPSTNIFVLANHGLVVCGESCAAAEDLLREVERRLAVSPRQDPIFDNSSLPQIDPLSPWALPEATELHALSIDAISRRVLGGGILFPCQAVFLGNQVASMPRAEILHGVKLFSGKAGSPAFVLIEDWGVLTNRKITVSQRAVLQGLLHVVQRVDVAAPVRYLSDMELQSLLNEDARQYQLCTENNAVPQQQPTNHAATCS